MLGPLLFLIFVNDLQYNTNMLNPHFFPTAQAFLNYTVAELVSSIGCT